MTTVNPELPSVAALMGRDCEPMVAVDGRSLHADVIAPLQALQQTARHAGFDLRIASGFRDYERQRAIWNAKALGSRAVNDAQGVPIDTAALDANGLMQAILRWSALPGTSRHHWGSDFDVYDAAAVAEDYDVQLTDTEVYGEGPFAPMHDWLDGYLATDAGAVFRRPYEGVGAVAPERWHLSYQPLAVRFERLLQRPETVGAMETLLAQDKELALQQEVLQHFGQLYADYVAVYAIV